MAFNIEVINKSIGLYVLILLGIPTIVTSNIDCGRKPFHCVNATHFMICVDLGGGVSRTIDNYVYECPSPTECQPSNSYECEFPEATTQPPRVSDVTNELLVNNNTTLRSEDTIVTISPLNNTSQAIQPEAILTIDVTSTTTTNSYTTNDQNITDNASNHTDGLLINFTPGNIDEKTDVLNNDIITNVTTTFDSTTLPVDSMSLSTNMSTEESTTMFTIYTTSEDKVNGTASTNNILGIENVTETTERVNSSTDQVTSSTYLILSENNSKTDSLSTDIASSTTSGDDSNASTIDIPPKDNTNKSLVSGDTLDITNNTENVFSTQSEVSPNTFVTLPSVTASGKGIYTTLVITEGTAITVSTDKSATDDQFEYLSSATTDGLIPINGITDEVATTTAPTLADSKNVTATIEPNNLPIHSVTSNNVNISKVETNQITEATTFSTDGLPSTFAYQFEHNTDKNYTSKNIGNNKTESAVDKKPKDNINKSNVSSSALDIKNKSENLSPPKPEVALPNIPVTLPSVVVSSESTITTVVITEGTAVTISTNESSASTAYNQSEGEGTAITKNISEYYSTSAPSTLTSKIGATDAIEMTTAPLITDIKNEVTTIVEPIDLPVESVTLNNDNVNKDMTTKVTDGTSVATDESIRSTMDHIFEVTTRKYDVSNNVSNNKTVSTIDEHPKNNANKSEANNNALEIENRTENVLFTSPEGVLSNISAIIPSVTVSIEGPKITLVTTEATSVGNNSASTAYNQSKDEGTAITKNISEYYSTSAPSTLTSKMGATDAIVMTMAPLITDTKNDVTANVEPIYLPVDSVTSNNDNVNKDVITKVTDDASLSTVESIRSTMDHPFEVTTRKYDVSNNITNDKTVSTIDEHPKYSANKSDVTNNAIEIENRTENVLFTSPEGVLFNISGTFPSETVSSEGTIITLLTTEATQIITSANNNSASTIYNQSENKSSESTINNNNFSEHFSTTEALILTSKTADTSAIETTMDPTIADTKNDITSTIEPIILPIDLITSNNVNENKDEVNQFNASMTVSIDQSVRSTTDYLFEVTTNKYDISDTVTNNKTVSTIEVQPEDTVNKSEVSNNTTEIGNRTENGLIIESEATSSNISSSFTPVAALDDATESTAVIAEGTTITILIDENLLTVTDKQPEENTTDIINNISVTNFTNENIAFTSQSVTAGPIETIASSTIAATKNETATVQPITLPTVTSNDVDVNKDLIISVTEAIAFSTDQGIRSTIDSQFQQVSTGQHDTSKVNNNKTLSTIDEKLKSNVSDNAIESENRTENLLPPGSEVALPFITITVPSESTTATNVITDGIATTIYTNNNPASNMDKQPGHEISATTIINNISEKTSTLDGITLTTKTNEYKMTTDSIIAPTKNVTPDAEPIALPTDSVTSLNSKQDVLSQVTESTTFSKDQSLSSTLDFEQNTNKTENVNNKTLSTIDGSPQDKVNKADVSTNAKGIENQTENSLLTGAEDTLFNILITSPSGATASESTITTVLVREGSDIPMSTEKNLASSIGKQPEHNEIVTDIFTNISTTNLTAENLNSSSQKVTADPIKTITVPIIASTKDGEAIIGPIASVTSNYGNGNQDILITVTETTVISNDQTTRSTIDYKFEENTKPYKISYNANNKSGNSPTTVLDPIYLNSIDKNEAVISNGKVTENPTGLPLHSITLPLVEASSEGIISAAVDNTKNTPIFESKQDTTIDKNPEFKMPESASSNNKLQIDKTENNFQTEGNNLQSTEIQGISIPSMKQATDIVYDFTVGAEILLESPTLSTVSPIPTASSQDAMLNFNTTKAVNRTETKNKTTTYSIDKQHDGNETLNINNNAKYATETTKVSTNKSTVSLMEGSLNIWTDTANDNLVLTTENKSNKTENNAILDDLNLTTDITQNTKIPINSVPLVNVESVTGSFGQTSESVKSSHSVDSTLSSIVSSGHEENFTLKDPNISTKDKVTFAAVTKSDDFDTTNVIYNLSKTHQTDYSTNTAGNINKTNSFGATMSASISTFTENTTSPSYVIPGNSVSVETSNDLNLSTHVSNQDTKDTTTKIESSTSSVQSHFVEKEISVTETNIPTLRDTSSPSYASKAIYTPNTNANTQSFIKNIHEKGSSVNNGVTNVMQEGTIKDVINDFNKNDNVIGTLQSSPPMSSKTNSYKDSNTIATTHKSPSQFSTSHVVETAHSVKNSTSASGQVFNDNPLINLVFNNDNTNIQPITSLVINETNFNNEIDLNSSNSTKLSSENSLLPQNSNNKPQQHSHDNSNSNIKRSEVKFNCNHHRRGRYADQDNCRKFYICIGRLTPIVGECPANTVFSENTKQCTKNLSHCVRGNQFHCETSGRFSDLTQQSVYYICVKNKLDSYVRFKFQCQEGYSLNKETVRCIETEPERSISNDNESENERKRNRYDHKNEQRRERKKDNESENENERKRNRYNHKNEHRRERENDNESENKSKRNRYDHKNKQISERENDSESENESNRNRYHHKNEQRRQRKNDERDSEDERSESKEFECEEEGKFAHPDNCRQYYKCSKNRRSEYRRRIKSCDSDELFDESKKKCVDAESYECQRK